MPVDPVVPWPVGVPSCIQPLSPQGGRRDNRLSFETDSKMPPIERPVSSWTPEVYAVELVPMSLEQFRLFQNWYSSGLAWGVRSFAWYHPITRDVSSWKILKADPPYQVSKSRMIRLGSDTRGVSVSFTVMSTPRSFPPGYLLQENSDLALQENSDRIIVSEGYVFRG